MFAYCNNNPVSYIDPTGHCACALSGGLDNKFKFAAMCPCGGGSGGGTVFNSSKKSTRLDYLVANESETTVLTAERFAFYKGTLVIKVPGSSSFSFGIIFMGNDGDKDLLNHEYGHTMQLAELGIIEYCTYVVIPSVICYWGTEFELLPYENYYSYPWEYQADQYGGVTRKYKEWAKDNATYYWSQVS